MPERILAATLKRARTTVAVGLLLIVAGALLATGLTQDGLTQDGLPQDIRSDAFLSSDNPALVYRDKLREEFGLADPIIVAVEHQGERGIFTPEVRALVQWLSDKIGALANVDQPALASLASEKNITGSPEDIEIAPFLDPLPGEPSAA